MDKKLIIAVIAILVITIGIGIFLLWQTPQPPTDNCPTIMPPSPALEERCKQQGGVMIPSYDQNNCVRGYQCSTSGTELSSDNGVDADGFLWGTEVYPNQLTSTEDILSNTLKTRYLKIRLQTTFFLEDKFTSTVCMPSPLNCQSRYDMDEIAKMFKENSWSMMPMFSHNPGDNDITEEDILHYVNFVEWFVSRYKDDANIKYVELVNAPGSTWKGTDKQLLELNNKAYERLKSKYPDLMIGTPGFEYFNDVPADTEFSRTSMLEYFLDETNGAKFDFWAFHGYSTVILGESSGIYPYPPTKTALYNKYAGIEGILEIRKKLDENGWQDREIIDTEHIGISSHKPFISDEEDKLNAAYTVQELLLKRTLQNNGQFVLAGILPLKIIPRGGKTNIGEFSWGSLNSDGSETKTVKAVALLLSKLNEYKYSSHLSGEFDNENQAWVEKFSAGNKELYIFFKPFKYQSGKSIQFDNEVLNYNLKLRKKPTSAILTDINGIITSIAPTETITLNAENPPKFLEVEY